jgi:signal transduction histidine kinase
MLALKLAWHKLLMWWRAPPTSTVSMTEQVKELKALVRHLQAEREVERGRLARDLHDELGSLLTIARLDMARLKPKLALVAPELMDGVVRVQSALDELMCIKGRVTEDLWPSALVNLGLAPSLDILVSKFIESTGINVSWQRVPVRLGADAQLAVYRLVQEGVTNIIKHADATAVWIRLGAVHGVVTVSIVDNGVGFEWGRSPGQACGLMGMRMRTESMGGEMSLLSAPGLGTRILIQLREAMSASGSGSGLKKA